MKASTIIKIISIVVPVIILLLLGSVVSALRAFALYQIIMLSLRFMLIYNAEAMPT